MLALVHGEGLQHRVKLIEDRNQNHAPLGRSTGRQNAQRAILHQPRPFAEALAEPFFEGADVELAEQTHGFSRVGRHTDVQCLA